MKNLDASTKVKFDAMISAGIFNGVSETTFGLKDEMNRAQFAKVAALIMGLDINMDLHQSSFTDVSMDDPANGYALPYIEALKGNNSTQPHSLHPHGITSVDMLNDGVPHITGNYMMPGTAYTYEFVAKEAGTHWYHCHVQTSLHQDMGIYGSLIIEDTEKPSWDKEFTMMLDEWDTHRDPANATAKPTYNYFSVNGKSGQSVPDMVIKDGEIARIRLINAGFESHPMHLHGTHFIVITKDGYKVPQPYNMDTVNIAPGETYDVLVKGRDGIWPWHDHNSLAATDDRVYPGGMLMHVRGSGDNKFNPDANPTLVPVQGHIHASDEHALTTHGDPSFIKEKMTYNSEEWLNASPNAEHSSTSKTWNGVNLSLVFTIQFPAHGHFLAMSVPSLSILMTQVEPCRIITNIDN